jgi:hypothetical protein
MKSFFKAVIVLLITIPAWTTIVSSQSKGATDPLKSYTTCQLPGDLKVKEVTRRPKSLEKYREVTTAKGMERVSVVDGYRVMLGYENVRYYFANIKIEQSDAGSYALDKERVINDLSHAASTKQATKILLSDKTILNGFEHHGIDRDVIDVGGTLGIHVLFYDADHLIITIYFLNEEKKNRRFGSIDEYRALRGDFLNHYTECLNRISQSQP